MSALFRRIKSKHNEEFYCLNCFYLFRTENKPKKQYNVCKNHDYCYVETLKEDKKILKYNHGEKPMKVSFVIYVALEPLLEKTNTCHNNPRKPSTIKINKHALSGYLLFTHCSFGTTRNKLDYYRGKSCMKNLCVDLREQNMQQKKLAMTKKK